MQHAEKRSGVATTTAAVTIVAGLFALFAAGLGRSAQPSPVDIRGPFESIVLVSAGDERERPRPLFDDNVPILIRSVSVTGGSVTVFDGPTLDPLPARPVTLSQLRGTAIAHVESDLMDKDQSNRVCQTVVLPLDVVAHHGAYIFARGDTEASGGFRATIVYKVLD